MTVAGLDAFDTVGVALLRDGEPVPGLLGLAMGGVWALHLDGQPLGVGSSHLRPVAYLESDGVLGFDPEEEEVVGEACSLGAPAFVRWLPAPLSPDAADSLTFAHATPGWNAWRGEGKRTGALRGDAAIVMSETCP